MKLYIFVVISFFACLSGLCRPLNNVPSGNEGETLDTIPIPKETDTMEWGVFFTVDGREVHPDSVLFMFEVFVNGTCLLTNQPGSSTYINRVLLEWYEKISSIDEFKIILLNSSRFDITINRPDRTEQTADEEIPLVFFKGQEVIYAIHLTGIYEHPVDYHFFYIEKSGGIRNLRDVRVRLDSLAEEKQTFMVYFNGPGLNPFIISDPKDLMSLYNLLFISETQPPNPNEERQRVNANLTTFLAGNEGKKKLHLYFYLSQTSFRLLTENFIYPLIENYTSEKKLNQIMVYFLTDFSVKSGRSAYNYININE